MEIMQSSRMIAGVAFDLYGGLFSVAEAAAILGMKPSVLAMWGQRGFGPPTRREGSGRTMRGKKRSRQGKGLYSARDLVKLRTQQMLSDMGLSLKESVPVGDETKLTSKSVAKRLSEMEAAEISEAIAMTGEWMWATARGLERGQPFPVYAYAARVENKWRFDMHVGKVGEPPCFGWQVPHIYLPMSEIFMSVYTACKKMLAETVVV